MKIHFVVEAKQSLVGAISSVRETVADSEKNQGKFNKEDKVRVLKTWKRFVKLLKSSFETEHSSLHVC